MGHKVLNNHKLGFRVGPHRHSVTLKSLVLEKHGEAHEPSIWPVLPGSVYSACWVTYLPNRLRDLPDLRVSSHSADTCVPGTVSEHLRPGDCVGFPPTTEIFEKMVGELRQSLPQYPSSPPGEADSSQDSVLTPPKSYRSSPTMWVGEFLYPVGRGSWVGELQHCLGRDNAELRIVPRELVVDDVLGVLDQELAAHLPPVLLQRGRGGERSRSSHATSLGRGSEALN